MLCGAGGASPHLQCRLLGVQSKRTYHNVFFSVEALREVIRETETLGQGRERKMAWGKTATGDAEWDFDTEPEFFAEYRKHPDSVSYGSYQTVPPGDYDDQLYVMLEVKSKTTSSVTIRARDRPTIEALFHTLERHVEACRIPQPHYPEPEAPRPMIFIGHGRDIAWRDLKDHLTDKHGYAVHAYEVGARAGHTIRDFLDDMLRESTVALIVLTAEDETADALLRARQNVVHELGLFQGRLGFSRAIAIVENGTELMTNLDGVQQLRFEKGNIASTFGDVLATLRREFGDTR